MTTPQRTSETGDLTIEAGGSIVLQTGVPAVTVDSNNNVVLLGNINIRDGAVGATGIFVDTNGGRTANITIGGNIGADETSTAEDEDDDLDLDGPFVEAGTLRYGIRIVGDSVLIGNIIHNGGVISVDGEGNSAAISLESGLTGDFTIRGGIGIQGSDTVAIRLGGPITGDVTLGGSIQAQGEDAIGVHISGPVTGVLSVDGQIIASGFRYSDRNALPTEIENLDEDDLLIGGPAILVTANLSRGLVIDAPPADLDEEEDDEDGDGIADASETTGSVFSLGSAPAIMIGAATDLSLGNAGTAERDLFGLIIRGDVDASGEYDGISATGIQIGGAGGAVNTTGGVSVTGEVNSAAFNADASGIRFGAGAIAPVLSIDQALVSAGVNADDGVVPDAIGVHIQQGASVAALENGGIVRAGVIGTAGSATAILDESGSLTTITNAGRISATVASLDPDEVVEGEAVAIDVRNNTSGVTVVQIESDIEGFLESITGDVLFGAGADTFSVATGNVTGAVSFGDGNDSFVIDGDGTAVAADLRKGAGSLDIDVNGGRLGLTNVGAVSVASLDVASDATLTFTADPQNAVEANRATFVDVSGQAAFGAGSRVGLEFRSKLDGPTQYTLLSAGNLVNGGIDASLLGELPILFSGQLIVDGNDLDIAVRRATTDELGLSGGGAAMFEAFYAAFDADPRVAAQFFQKNTPEEFAALYQQFLPDYSGGPFRALAATSRAAMGAQAESGSNFVPGEPRSWLQEVGATVKQESVGDVSYETGGFGLVGGVERPYGENTFVGASLAYQSSEIRNGNRALGSFLSASTLTGSLYWRQARGNLVLDSSVMGGFAWFDSVRRIADVDAAGAQLLIRQSEGDWNGFIGGGRLGATYNWQSGRFYARPDFVLDAVFLSERGYTETGGGGSVDLAVGSRSNYEAGAEVGVLMGAQFGRTFKWGPELRLGYRAILASGDGETSGAFVSAPGSGFAIPGLVQQDGLMVIRAALRGQGAYTNFAIEAGGDIGQDYHAYTMRLLVRFLF